MLKLVLPFKYPMITTLPVDANAVSIISSDSAAQPWLFNNFIQLVSTSPNQPVTYFDFHYRNSPILTVKKIDKELIDYKNFSYIISFFKKAIEMKNYIYLIVNRKYIKAYRTNSHTSHDMMIYGFDDEMNRFHIADCFVNGKYAYSTCTYKELFDAINHVSEKEEYNMRFKKCFEFISYERYELILFNIERVKTSIFDYINSAPTTFWYTQLIDWHTDIKTRRFGLDCYDAIIESINRIQSGDAFIYHAYLSIHLMWEHKNVMLKRLIFMNKNMNIIGIEHYIQEYCEIEQKSLRCMNLFIKYSITRDIQLLGIIIKEYDELKLTESIVLSGLQKLL